MEQRGSDGRFHFVYRTTNLLNGRYYIGKHSTRVLEDKYLGSGKRFWNELNKYGRENFTREILFFCETAKDAFAKEKEFISDLHLLDKACLNLVAGGKGGWDHPLCDNTGNKRKTGNYGWKNGPKYSDPKYREAVSKGVKKHLDENGSWWVGRSHSAESLSKMSFAKLGKNTGENNSQFGTCWITGPDGSMKIKKDELDKYIQLGFSKGRKI